jgi:hypothetical protein
VSKLESGDLSHTEVGTLQSYVAALGGHLRVVANFGENPIELPLDDLSKLCDPHDALTGVGTQSYPLLRTKPKARA